jgi:integrase
MRKTAPPKPHKRAGFWYLVRRVPAEFAVLDKRVLVRLSTDIRVADDPRAVRAAEVIKRLDAELQAYWRGLRDGQDGEARRRFDEAQKRARKLGLPYQTNAELAEGPIAEVMKRVQILIDRGALDDEQEAAAVMGAEPRPAYMVSDLPREYEAIQSLALGRKSENQLRKWRNPKLRAVNNFIEALGGDRQIDKLTRADAVKFRLWWEARIAAEKLDIGTANKDLGHINKMYKALDILHQLDLKPIFSQLRIDGERDKQAIGFTPEWVQTKILAAGALDALNEQARHIVYLLADHGWRPSEVCNLRRAGIHLDAKVPYMEVRDEGREVKTDDSLRQTPLTKMGIAILKMHPEGFPRYQDKEDSFSGLVNDFLRTNGLLETPAHTVYGLRHCFEDRLTAVEAPDRVAATLMGHKWHRPKYGQGPTLDQKRRWLNKIAFTQPAHFGPREQTTEESGSPAGGGRRAAARPQPPAPAARARANAPRRGA